MIWLRRLSAVLVLALSLARYVHAAPAEPASVPSPKAQAQTLLIEGNRRLDQGLYLEALELFERAFAVYPSPKLHFSIAATCNELGRLLEALDHYEAFTRDVKKEEAPGQWNLAHARIFELQGRIASVELQTNVTEALVTADGRAVGRTPLARALRFMPGPHAVIVSKPGYERQVLELNLSAGASVTRRVKLLTEAEAVASRRAFQLAEARRQAALERLRRVQEEERQKRQRTRRILQLSGWAALGTGAALALVGGTFGILAHRENAEVTDAAPGTYWPEVSAHYDRARTYRQVLLYGTAIGGALAVGGGVLLGLGYRGAATEKPHGLTAAPAVGSRHLGVALAGVF